MLRFIGRLAFLCLAALLVASLIAVALIVLALSLVRALVTGRRPSPAHVFANFKRYAPQGMWPGATPQGTPAEPERPTSPRAAARALGRQSGANVVEDIQARDIPPTKPL